MDKVQDPCALDARRRSGGAPSASELASRVTEAHLVRQVTALARQLEDALAELASVRGAIERLMVQRDVVDEATSIVEAEYDRLGAEGAL